MVTAFTKYGNCSSESFLADVSELDFGTVTTPMSEVKIVNLRCNSQPPLPRSPRLPSMASRFCRRPIASGRCFKRGRSVSSKCAFRAGEV